VRNTEKYQPSPNEATRPDFQKKVAHNWAVAEALTKRPMGRMIEIVNRLAVGTNDTVTPVDLAS
jgi:hypothetical protein